MNTVTVQDNYTVILIVRCMKLKSAFMNILVRIKKCFSLAIIRLTQNIIKFQINYLLVRQHEISGAEMA